MTLQPVTVLGLGAMGAALARAFVRAGHPTTVWNRTPERARAVAGAAVAGTAADAVAASGLTVVCVLDDDAVGATLEGAPLDGRTVVNLTNGTPRQARDRAAWAESRGARYVDGGIMAVPPMIGRPDALVLYSGSRPGFAEHRAALEVLGAARFSGTDPGLAALHDIALLSGMYGSLAGFLQAVALVRTEGVRAADFMELLGPWLAAMAQGMPRAARRIDAGDYGTDVVSNLAMQAAGFANLEATAREQGVSSELLRPLGSLMERRVAAGHGDEDLYGVVELLGGAACR